MRSPYGHCRQYHDPAGPYYGGVGPEPSRALLREFLATQNLTTWRRLVQIDLHTGLGPTGMDTLMVDEPPTLQVRLGALRRPVLNRMYPTRPT